ncbi:MAG TPA: lipopolysaccharide kinase InaA family protein [Planctomycetota bacterium]|nr:lipopolysaccharide kinase InaA family protein [Planctomycetota bacterium]
MTVRLGPALWRVAEHDRAFLEAVDGLRHDRLEGFPGLRILKRKESRFWGNLRAGGKEYFIKGRRIDRVRRSLRTFLRTSPMREEWRKAWWLREGGIETPEPVAVGEVRRLGLLRESFFACRWMPGALSLRAFLEEKESSLSARGFERLRARLLILMGRLFGSLHSRGALHWEFHEQNMLVVEESPGVERIVPIDLDHLVLPSPFRDEDREWNFFQLAWYLRKPMSRWRLRAKDVIRFLKGYHEVLPLGASSFEEFVRLRMARLPPGPLPSRPRRGSFHQGLFR